MKKMMNKVAIFGILFLLGLGYVIPTVLVIVEDKSMQSEVKTYEMEEISLSFNEVDLKEELKIISELIINNVIVERGGEEKVGTQNYKMAEESVKSFFQALGIAEEIEFVSFSVSYYAMMADGATETVYPLWVCYGVDEEKNKYQFWIDDITGKVIAFEIPISVIKNTDAELEVALTRLGKYYNLSTVGLVDDIEYYDEYIYWENYLCIIDEDTGEELYLYIYRDNASLCFNMYPGTTSMYYFTSQIDRSSEKY